jgi:hypothetical protein
MMYLFYGSDSEKARRKAFEWVAAARKKEPQLYYLRLAREDLSQAAIEEVAASNTLFAKRSLILLDDPFPAKRASEDEDEDEGEEASSSLVEDNIEILAESNNAVVILAPKLLASKAKKIAAKAKMEYKFDVSAALDAARGFNTGLVNALASKNGERLWLELERSLRAGDAPEQLHGLLHWKARDLLEKHPSPATRELSLSLIKLLQDSRRSGLDLSLSLERFALSI